jgi:Predicted rRNA methylase (SpoU class)
MIHIVLYEPEIPQNTGNIMRTCVATGMKLHLIEPLGFLLDEKKLRRSGMDYMEQLNWELHEDWQMFRKAYPQKLYFVTRYSQKKYTDFSFSDEEDIFLVFGKESTGIPLDILKENLETCMRIPMVADARSLNLSNSVSIVSFEVLRQLDFPNLSTEEVIKGKDWIY